MMIRPIPNWRASERTTRLLFMLLASCVSVTRSLPTRFSSSFRSTGLVYAASPNSRRQLKSFPCSLWSASFNFCVDRRLKSTTSPLRSAIRMAADDNLDSNPLLQDFNFPPFDTVEPKHVRPGIRELLRRLENDLVELESTLEPTWPKLVVPLEKIVDRLQVVWGIVNHLKSIKDSPELRSAIEEVQPEKVKFQLRLGQSKTIYDSFKAIQNSPLWPTLCDARKRIVEGIRRVQGPRTVTGTPP